MSYVIDFYSAYFIISTMNEGENFGERFLRLMNDRPDEEIPGTPEWTERMLRLADDREASYKHRLRVIRNCGLGLFVVTAALFGINEAAHIMPETISLGVFGSGGSVGLGAAIGTEINLLRTP